MYNRIKDGTKFDFKVGVMREVTRIEAKPSKEVSVVTLVEILNKIPKGKLTRIKDIENAFKTFYDVFSFSPFFDQIRTTELLDD